jgi:glycosyltransferase involved in cell wall biosynthesis
MRIIFINATALSYGGGAVTLKQFLNHVPSNANYFYIVFCSKNNIKMNFSKSNVKFIYLDFTTGLFRVYWDMIGLKRWSINNNIQPDLVVSLQNTTVNFDKKIPQIIYVMQAIPFVEKKWNFFSTNERTLWFYKNIYPFFMSMYLGDNNYVVTQSKWIKKEFSRKFNFPLDRIYPIRLVVKKQKGQEKIFFKEGFCNIFCPSSKYIYKNNIEIVNALIYLKHNQHDISNIKVYITIDKNDDKDLLDLILRNDLSGNFCFLGRITHKKVLEYYYSCDFVVFPSFLETFGLPLLEAASFGKAVIVANEKYSQEVVSEYKGARLLNIDSPKIWGEAILRESNSTEIYNRYEADFQDSWEDFFKLINDVIESK